MKKWEGVKESDLWSEESARKWESLEDDLGRSLCSGTDTTLDSEFLLTPVTFCQMPIGNYAKKVWNAQNIKILKI